MDHWGSKHWVITCYKGPTSEVVGSDEVRPKGQHSHFFVFLASSYICYWVRLCIVGGSWKHKSQLWISWQAYPIPIDLFKNRGIGTQAKDFSNHLEEWTLWEETLSSPQVEKRTKLKILSIILEEWILGEETLSSLQEEERTNILLRNVDPKEAGMERDLPVHHQ